MKNDETKSWFAVSVFLEGCQTDSPLAKENLWEERIVLVQAGSSSEACAKAAEWGRRQEHEYESMAGQPIQWRFRLVAKACEVIAETLTDGTEVFSRFLRKSEADGLQAAFED